MSQNQFLGQGKFAGVIVGTPNRSGPDGVVTDKDGKRLGG